MLPTSRGSRGAGMKRWVGVWVFAAFVPCIFWAGSAWGGTPATQPAGEQSRHVENSPIERLLTNLGNPDARVREAGRLGLMRLKREQLPELHRLVEKARPLLPSQTAVLRQIVREIYLAGETYVPDANGFMGIMMPPGSANQADFVPDNGPADSLGVVVTDCIPGFCASRGIEEGDIILGRSRAREFEPFHGSDDLIHAIGGLPVGATVQLLVLRRGQVIVVALTLDAHPHDIPTSDLVPAFRAVREKKFEAYWRREFEPILAGRVG